MFTIQRNVPSKVETLSLYLWELLVHLDAEHVSLVAESLETITERNTTAVDTKLMLSVTSELEVYKR